VRQGRPDRAPGGRPGRRRLQRLHGALLLKSPPAASAWCTLCLMPAPRHRPNAPAVHCQLRRLTPHAALADACTVAAGAGAAGAGRAHPLRPREHVPAVQPAPGALPHLSQGAPPCRRKAPALPAAPASARAAGRPLLRTSITGHAGACTASDAACCARLRAGDREAPAPVCGRLGAPVRAMLCPL